MTTRDPAAIVNRAHSSRGVPLHALLELKGPRLGGVA
jgi:hypothetical protein